MAQLRIIRTLQINNHLWVFTDPQNIEYEHDEDGVTMRATLRIHHEEHLTSRAADALEACDNNHHYISGDDPAICSCGKPVRQ